MLFDDFDSMLLSSLEVNQQFIIWDKTKINIPDKMSQGSFSLCRTKIRFLEIQAEHF